MLPVSEHARTVQTWPGPAPIRVTPRLVAYCALLRRKRAAVKWLLGGFHVGQTVNYGKHVGIVKKINSETVSIRVDNRTIVNPLSICTEEQAHYYRSFTGRLSQDLTDA